MLCLLATVSCALWGSAFPGIKAGYRLFGIPAADFKAQILFAGCRFFLAGVLTILFGSIFSGGFLRPRINSWGRIAKLGLSQTVLQYLFFYIGLAHASGVKSSIIESANVFVSILLACLIFRQEALTWQKMGGCALGFAGVVLVNLSGAGWGVSMSFLGEGFIFLSTVASAMSAVLTKSYSRFDSPVMLSGYQFLCGGAVMTAAGFLAGGRVAHVTGQGVAVLGYLAFLSATAYSLWSILLKYNPVSKVAVWGFTNPVFGVIFSMLFLPGEGQTLGFRLPAALLLVCLGICLVNRPAPCPEEGA